MGRQRKPGKLVWLDPGQWPVSIALCNSEALFAREYERMTGEKPKAQNEPFLRGRCWCLESQGDNAIIICLMLKSEERHIWTEMVAHEAVHALQYLKAIVGGDDALGREAEAYFVQWIMREWRRRML